MKVFIKSLKIFNKFLTIIALILGSYLVFFPFLPEAELAIAAQVDPTEGVVYQSKLATELGTPGGLLLPPPPENRIVIPRIRLNAPIYQGRGLNTLNKGLWKRPASSTPDKGGNTVIAGHRFQYRGSARTLYHLDKAKVGDKLMVFWNGKEYDYEIFAVDVVSPYAVEIEYPTEESIITLYTCTPLFVSSHRLVVKAKLI